MVVAFYDAYNKRDLATIQQLIADDISYHDLVYDEPHEGREGVMAWLKKVGDAQLGHQAYQTGTAAACYTTPHRRFQCSARRGAKGMATQACNAGWLEAG